MEKLQIIEKLNIEKNFHLSIKCIQITDNILISKIKENISNKIIVITSLTDCYDLLKKAYQENKCVLINEKIDFVVPLLTIITTDCYDIIKYNIPVYYHLKDNKVISKLKTECNKKHTVCRLFKSKEDLYVQIINFIKKIV